MGRLTTTAPLQLQRLDSWGQRVLAALDAAPLLGLVPRGARARFSIGGTPFSSAKCRGSAKRGIELG